MLSRISDKGRCCKWTNLPELTNHRNTSLQTVDEYEPAGRPLLFAMSLLVLLPFKYDVSCLPGITTWCFIDNGRHGSLSRTDRSSWSNLHTANVPSTGCIHYTPRIRIFKWLVHSVNVYLRMHRRHHLFWWPFWKRTEIFSNRGLYALKR